MRRAERRFTLCLVAVLALSRMAYSLNVAVGEEPSSSWTMESGTRLEGGWVGIPTIITLVGGTYRMYHGDCLLEYYPLGGIIKSANSTDGLTWNEESGIRVGYGNGNQTGSAGNLDVVTLYDGTLRIYYTHAFWTGPAPEDYRAHILSAVSTDGLIWATESGVRVDYGGTYDSHFVDLPEVMRLPDGSYRMYYTGHNGTYYRILSAVSTDGLNWTKEPGIRIDIGETYDSLGAFSPMVVRVPDGRCLMFYTGLTGTWESQILSALSTDGLNWTKEPGIRIERGNYTIIYPGDLVRLTDEQYRMYITADRYPIWEDRYIILSAIGTIPEAASVGGYRVPVDIPAIVAQLTVYSVAVAIITVAITRSRSHVRKTHK